MSARDELWAHIHDSAVPRNGIYVLTEDGVADEMIAAGYTKPRTITTAEELDALAFGSAVQTSDESDTVVLKAEGDVFRNQSGYAVNALTLWSYGTQPFTVLYEPAP